MDSEGPRFCLLLRIITGGDDDDDVGDETFFSSNSRVYFVLYIFINKLIEREAAEQDMRDWVD